MLYSIFIHLKAIAMKKKLTLSALIFVIAFIFNSICSAQTSSIDKTKLIGIWQQCDSVGNPVPTVSGFTEYKLLTPESFTVLKVNKETGVFVGIFFGSYSLENDTYTETLTYATPQLISIKGTKNLFYIDLKNDLLYISGINNPYKQIWKKANVFTESK